MRELVVSHFHEDLSWIEDRDQVMVYSKNRMPETEWLPNIGREGHTFAHHVAVYYHDLKEITIFSQGNPFDHCKDFLKLIEEDCPWFTWLADIVHDCDETGMPHIHADISGWHEKLTGRPFPGKIKFGGGGQFMATRECLHAIPRNKWQWIVAQAEEPQFPWLMERTWGALLEKI